MKFIHTSDWHIGRQLHNQSLLDDQRYALEQVVQLAIENEVDAVLVAGDIYDRSVPPSHAVALLDEVLNQLVNEAGIPVLMIAGNHDGHERIGFGSRQMRDSGLHITGPLTADIESVTISSKSGDAVVYMLPYAEPATVRHVFDCEVQTHEQAMQVLVDKISADDSHKLPKIVMAHCFIDGGDESDSERPLSIGGADKIAPSVFNNFDYVALGHLHGPQQKGEAYIRYSGSLLKYSFSEENQNKSVTLVEVDEQGTSSIDLLPILAKRDVRIIEGELDSILEQGKVDPNRDDYVMVKLLDTHAILDAMGKIRDVYANVLHLERTGLMANNEQLAISRDHIKKGEMTMFGDFFSQVSGAELTEVQQQVVSDTIDAIHKGEQDA